MELVNLKNEQTEEIVNDKNIVYCASCGKAIDLDNDAYIEDADGNYICDDCSVDYYYCNGCHEYHYIDDGVFTQDTDNFYCRDCVDDCCYKCEDCGDYFDNDYHLTNVIINDCGDTKSVCVNCIDNYCYCNDCDNYFISDMYDYDNDCCINCASRFHSDIKQYHDHHGSFSPMQAPDEKDAELFMGFELEIQGADIGSDTEKDCVCDLITTFNNTLVFERDSSIGEGFEIISQPLSERYFYKCFDLENLLATCKSYNYTSHDNGDCGLHLHFTRHFLSDNDIAKIVYFYNTYYSDFIKLSRRTLNQADEWAQRYCVDNIEDAKEIAINKGYSRYYAVNLCNSNTIEFRLGRGTLNYKSFVAWVDLHFTIVKNAHAIKWSSIDNVSEWLQGITTDTISYINSRDAFSGVTL